MKRVAVVVVALATMVLSASDAGAGSAAQIPPPRSTVSPHAGVRATVLIDPLRVGLKLKVTTVRAGTTVQATESVLNFSKLRLSKVTVTIEPLTSLSVKPDGSQTIGPLPAKVTATMRWSLCASRPRTYAIVAQATGQNAVGDRFVAYGPAETLVVTTGSGRCT